MAKPKQITDFKECPYCGGGGYYVKLRASGNTQRFMGFDNHDVTDNHEMFDSVKLVPRSAYYFCEDCHKKICKRKE